MPDTDVSNKAQSLKVVAGIAAVLAGLFVLLFVALVAIGFLWDNPEGVVAVATSAFAVIGSVVGAYFGVKEGSSGTQKAIEGMHEHASRAQAFAAHVPASEAGIALERAQGLGKGTLLAQPRSRPPRGFVEPVTEAEPEPEQES